MMRFSGILVALALLVPGAAHAKWQEASSPHFVIYADDSEKDIREFAQQLEMYHAAMEVVTGREVPVPSPSSRLTVYVVNSQSQVRRLARDETGYAAGFYSASASGSIAVVPRLSTSGRDADWSRIILMHEYAHHFLISGGTFALPGWMKEGGAEFFSSADFPSSGGVSLGRPAQHRAMDLSKLYSADVEGLFDPAEMVSDPEFYARAWLLYHYLTFSEERAGQMVEYARRIASGGDALETARAVFGDFSALNGELRRYLRRRTMSALSIGQDQLDVGEVAVRQLGEGEAAVMPLAIQSRTGVTREEALELVPQLRQVAEKYPDSPAVLASLAEAEVDSGHYQRAIEAADGAIALDAEERRAYVQKGYALFRMAGDAADKDAAYKAAMAPFIALNKIENDHPLPLIYFFHSYVERGKAPSELAVRGLERAVQLAPYDKGVRLLLLKHELSTGAFEEAKYDLKPLAFDPHGGALAVAARQALEMVESGVEGEEGGKRVLALFQRPEDGVAAEQPEG